MGEVRDVDFRGGRSHTPNQHDDRSHGGGPRGTGGDGGNGDVLEPRVAKLESHVEHIQRDTTDIKQKLERVADDVSSLKVSMATLAGQQDSFDIKLDAMDKKFDGKFDAIDKKFDAMDKKFESKFDALDKRFDGLNNTFATNSFVHEAFNKQQQWMFRSL
ncbi:hypothetical protein [Aeromonas salmonicida]|uniref:hypothetical protein n=1 Tax=Aeromonas salmonicida TaxID=645 RepID=UPI0012692F93|nr:hypothetical protein [Aeromonas salmonicida]